MSPKVLAAVIITAYLAAVSAVASPVESAMDEPALTMKAPTAAVILAVTRAGHRLVAVGEFGLILLSEDDGRSWRQVAVPVSVTLTAVQFASEQEGWAVGHFGIVLHTADGGATWQKRLDGERASALALAQAKERMHHGGAGDAASGKALDAAQQLVDDGPDKPFFDVNFLADGRGLVVGAYGLAFHTDDGGQSWVPWMDRTANDGNAHLYAIARNGDELFLCGEQGTILRSTDGGEHFARLAVPYDGTFFGVQTDALGHVLAYGLRGNVYRSDDHGEHWRKVELTSGATFNGGKPDGAGRFILVSQASEVLVYDWQADRATRIAGGPQWPISNVELTDGGALVVAGLGGVARIQHVGGLSSGR